MYAYIVTLTYKYSYIDVSFTTSRIRLKPVIVVDVKWGIFRSYYEGAMNTKCINSIVTGFL